MKRKTGFYLFLFMCMVGLGIAAFFINNDEVKTKNDQANTSKVDVSSYIVSSFELVSSKPESSKQISSEAQSSQTQNEQVSQIEQSVVQTAAVADYFVYPLTGEIIKDYSDKQLLYSKTYDDWRVHKGVDIKGSFGENIHAAGDGMVKEVYYDELYGNTMVIDHGNGILIYYCGLDKMDFKAGQSVLANQTIATLGELPFENLEGVHLHLEVKKDGENINPMDIIS